MRVCSETLSGVHVFKTIGGSIADCRCGAEPTDEERVQFQYGVERLEHENMLADIAKVRRGEH